jgi:hypothetical protein
MKPELLTKIASRYRQEYESFGKPSGASSFNDVLNLVRAMESIGEYYSSFETRDEKLRAIREFRVCRNALRNYFDLLNAHPDYREAELYGDEMAEKKIVGFPDLLAYCNSAEGVLEQEKIFGGNHPHVKEHYIMLSKQRLEDIAKNS